MNATLFSAAVAALALLPLTAQAQTTIIASDNASSAAYGGTGYAGLNGGTGFGAFNVVTTGAAGTFEYTSKESEDGSANIDSPAVTAGGSPLSFGLYAQTPGSATTITRSFNAGPTAGDTFSLDFVTGYNDGANGSGMSGVSLTDAAGAFGTFSYQSNDQYLFNGATITGQGYTSGALHLVYDITSATTYSLSVTGPFSFSGTGTFAGPVTGFQVAQTNSGSTNPAHNAYFNNLSETAPASAAPEPSQIGVLLIVCLGVVAAAARKRAAHA
jgi:hypothetical protein